MSQHAISEVVAPVPEVKSAEFVVSAALFEELGERLVSKPEIALAELIKNAYDADSPICSLELGQSRIVVSDKGHGMTEYEFINNWMVVSTQRKGIERFSRIYSRHMAGSKGIGRFSARFLGNTVTLTSVAFDDRVKAKTRLIATFDWRRITKESSIAKVKIPYTLERVGPSTQTGTSLQITQLREDAKDISPSTVKTDILRLTDPAAGLEQPPFHWSKATNVTTVVDPGFEVVFSIATPEASAGMQLSESVAAQILAAFVGRVRLELTEDGRLKYEVSWDRGKRIVEKREFRIGRIVRAFTRSKLKPQPGQKVDARGLPAELKDVQHLPLTSALHSPVFIDLRFFPKRKGTFTGLPVNGVAAQRWLSEHASIALVDNNFVMPAYAHEDSDWLGIDASKAKNERNWQSVLTPALYPMDAADRSDPSRNPMLALPRGTQLIGRVHIATRKRPAENADASDDWLQPNMDRESLRANGAYRLLWHVSRFAAELIANFDRRLRIEEQEREERALRKASRTALSSAIEEVRTSKDIEPVYRKQFVERLQDIQARIDEAAAYEKNARVSLELMSMMGVMAGFMTHEFEKSLGDLKEAAQSIRRLVHLEPGLLERANAILKSEKALANQLDYMRFFVTKAREARLENFKAHAQVALAAATLGNLTEAHHIRIDIDISAKLPGPHIPLAAYNGIVINLVSNAMKALIPKRSKEQRRIRIYATNDEQRHTLVCMDNGIGIPDYLRTRIWDPLFTTTADGENPLGSGLGLGLTLVQRVVSNLSGRIELLDVAPPGFTTAFRVSLPLKSQ